MNSDLGKNYTDFRAAFLHSKFWTHNSVLVPNTKITLNEDFIDIHSLIRIPEQIEHFRVYWINKGIAGDCCLPGQWNYAYIDGKFYHLIKMHSVGFIKGMEDEFFMYNIIYDDWMNDWMNNTFYLKGTLELTGDTEIVKKHIHQMSPIIENVNGYRFLNGIKKTTTNDLKTELILPKDIPLAMRLEGMSSADKVGINQELEEFHKRGELKPREEKLWIPFMYRCDDNGNWKWTLLQQIRRHQQAGFKVYDVTVQSAVDAGQAQNFRNKLEIIMGSNELYLLSSEENRVFSFAKSLNPTKRLATIDLSGCTDVTVLNRLELSPLYTIENPEPKFTIREFVDKICNRQGWPSDYKSEMVEHFENIVIPQLAPILGFNDDRNTKVFRDVTLERIERDVVGRDHLGNKEVKNPEWLNWSDSQIVGEKHHKNFIWDNIGENPAGYWNDVLFVYELTATKKFWENNINPDNYWDNTNNGNKFKNAYKTIMDTPLVRHEDWVNLWKKLTGNTSWIPSKYTLEVSPTIALVYQHHRYKLTSKDDTNDYLDFSTNLNNFKRWFLLLPDYDRKTHVLATNGYYTYTDNTPNNIYKPSSRCITDGHGLLYDPKDPKAVARTRYNKNGQTCSLRIFPVIFDEIEDVKDSTVTIDWERPSAELLREYLKLGKNVSDSDPEYRGRANSNRAEGAELLSRGYAFMALNGGLGKRETSHYLRKKDWKAYCKPNSNFCDYDQWWGDVENPYWTADAEWANKPDAQYTQSSTTKEWDWREFQTEMSFPVKTDNFSIMDILREYEDIPDNFLRWEVINSNIKKGKIKKYMRSYWHTNKSTPGAYRYGKEQEAAVPKNTVVMIWICTVKSYRNGDDNRRDDEAVKAYHEKTNKEVFLQLGKLLYKLSKLFFLTKWEHGGEAGAIPSLIKNESSLDSSGKTYPKDGDGRSQLSISWCKPHQGIWYIAWTRFYPAWLSERFRVVEDGTNTFNKQGTEDWFATMIPDKYELTGNYKPRFTYRDRTNNITKNNLLAFLSNYFEDRGDFPNIPEEGVDPSWLMYIRPWSNKTKEIWKNDADRLHERFRRCFYNWDQSLILDDYIFKHRTYTSRRTDNPKKFPEAWKLLTPSRSTYAKTQQSPFDKEVPPFVIPYLNPDSEVCTLHGWEKNDKITSKSDRMQLYKDKLNQLTRSTLMSLESWNEWIKFEGTNWYASIKLNTKGGTIKWDYELFTNEVGSFINTETEKWNLVNHKETDVDVIINTRNELNIYGNKFPLKSRNVSEEDELDIGLHVKALEDVKQTEAAAWYSVQMNLNDQDILQTFIETPKELVKYQGFSAYERERLIREIGLRGEEYIYNKQMLEYQREENKFTNQYEKDWIYKEWKYDVARGATQIIGGALDVVTGGVGSAVASMAINIPQQMAGTVFGSRDRFPDYETNMGFQSRFGKYQNAFRRPRTESGYIPGSPAYPWFEYQAGTPDWRINSRMAHYGLTQARSAAGGAMGIVGGALTIAEAYETFNIKDEYRKQKYAMAEKKLSAEGDILNRRHEFERKNLLNDLWAMSANVHYPQLNANIVYKLYNKHLNIRDVHMVQYYPKGKLLEYIKEYYKEFGYNIMVRNFECTGIQNIVNHLRYQFIYEINYPNISVQEMIRARALAGVKVIPWVQ